MLPEGTRAELIEETLYMSPAPTLDHQDIVVSISAAMFTFISKKKAVCTLSEKVKRLKVLLKIGVLQLQICVNTII